jgi:hypothetical protein
MSTTIVMPTAIQGAIQTMCTDAVSQAVRVLSAKYEFDLKEAIATLDLDKIEIKAGGKASSGKKATTDKPKTKRGTTGYLMFTSHSRSEVTAEMSKALADGEKLKPSQVVTELGARWRALSDQEKSEWNDKAKSKNADSSDQESLAQSSDDEASVTSVKEVEKETKKVEKKETKKVEKKETKKETKKVEKEEKKQATQSDSAPAKKKQNGYLLFGQSIRAEVKAELTAALEEGEKLKGPAVVTEIAARWKTLSDEEKSKWNDQASQSGSDDPDSD